MLSTWFNRTSDWNPQFIREVKGRFKPRNVLLAIAISVILQLAVIGVFYSLLPFEHASYSKYCVFDPNYSCVKDANGNYLVNWQLWWSDVVRYLHWMLVYGLMAPGVFMLVSDLTQEEQRGTLDFVRLSPQSAWTILFGKILGIPSLVYGAVAAAVPFHIVAAVAAGLPGWMLLSFYGVLLAGCFLLYSAALLTGFLSKISGEVVGTSSGPTTALGVTLLTALFFIPLFMMGNAHFTWHPFIQYFMGPTYSEFGSYNLVFTHIFTLVNLGIITYWIWQALHRCFHKPGATMISKKQSYGLIVYLEVLMLMIAVSLKGLEAYPTIAILSMFNIMVFFSLIVLLSNHRQSLVDWARYRHLETRAMRLGDRPERFEPKRVLLLRDLLLGERSPAVGAIALNLLIFGVMLLPLITFRVTDPLEKLYALVGVIITINLLLLYAAIVQLALLMKSSKRGYWATGTVGILIGLPFFSIAFVTLFGITASKALFLYSPIPWVALQLAISPTIGSMGLAIALQWLALIGVNIQLARQLKQVGQSASKQLLVG